MNKLTSARFWMAMMFSLSACVGFIMQILPVEAFMTLCGVVVTGYFNKQRPEEKGN